MDASQFDHLSKALTSLIGRRPLARVMAALPLLGATGLLAEETAARPRHRRVEAEKKKKKTCKDGLTRCRVKKGKKKKTICVNVQTDTAHCGGCGRACPGGQTCSSGACIDGTCTSDPKDVTCENRCGNVKNNCQQMVNCGVCECLPVTSTSELQAAIDAVDPGGELELCAGTWNITATVMISDDITLRGKGAGQTILDGNNSVRVLWIDDPSATVEIEALTIKRGFATGAENFGAGIRNDGALSLRRVEITKCQAHRGGGIFSYGKLDLYSDTRITDNTASDGGGLYAWEHSVTTMHDGSQLSDNTAGVGGGAGLFGCLFTMGAGSQISGNEGENGGGVYSLSATIVLQDGSVIGGSAPGAGNQCGVSGGGIRTSGGTVTLESGSKVIGNSANDGGGVSTSYGSVTLHDGSRISANSAVTNGGGISSFNGTLVLESGSVVGDADLASGNQCGSSGGGIYGIGGSVTVASGSEVIGNSAASGGGIAAGYGNVTVHSGSRVTGNVATDEGGGVLALGATVTVQSGVLLCDNSPPSSQCAGPFGGVCPQPATGFCP